MKKRALPRPPGGSASFAHYLHFDSYLILFLILMQPKQTIIARRRLRRQREIGRGHGGIFLYSTMAEFLALLIGCSFITTLYLMYTLDNHYDGQPDRNFLQEVVKKFEHIIYTHTSASLHDHVDSETRSSLDIKPFFVENRLRVVDLD